MQNWSKLVATLVMWAALTGFMITALAISPDLEEAWIIMPLTLVPLMFGFFVTLALWQPAIFPWIDASRLQSIQQTSDERLQSTVKRKRSAGEPLKDDVRLAFLLETMDAEAREAFKTLLKRRLLEEAQVDEEGEITYRGVSLSDLMDDGASRRLGSD